MRYEQHLPSSIFFAILAAISFTLMSLVGKIIGDGASTDTILFARFSISLVLMIPWLIKHPQEAMHLTHPKKLIWRSLFSLLSFACFFYALKFIPLSNALVLNNTFPLFVPLVALIHSKKKTSHKVWTGIVVGFIGVALILQPDLNNFHPHSFVALASGIFGAIAMVMIRHLTKMVSILQILFYYFLINSAVTAAALPFQWQTIDSSEVFLLLASVGLFGALYQVFSTLCFAKAPVRITSPIMSFCMVSGGMVADYLIWGQFPNTIGLAGIAFVILGGTWTVYFGQQEIAGR